ncbi:uncharacterized protein LOC129800826 [Phlebotomus papatasi]|uniref:uncharacterized protein LOC129800826 n=1 Tax=Phlebotomus papatasi TaxID=29031 RepID=UPI0024836E4B|nr:uncharacterized protein LOC129800826 [Phlebotomus papatasi]
MNYLNPLELSCEVKKEAISCTEELCRLCAKSVTSYSSIFQDNLHEYLTLIFGVSIQQNDNWPKSICNVCFEVAKNYVKYVLSVRRAETSLRSIYGELSNLEPGISFINVQEILNPEDTRDHASEGSDYNENEDENDIKVFPPGSENSFDTLEDSKIPNKITLNERQFLEESSKDNKPSFMEEYDGQTSEETEDLPTLNRRTSSTDKSTDEDERIRKFFKLECSVCSNPFETYNELKSHAIKIHKDQKLAFIICCKKKLDNRTKIVNHLNHHAKVDAYNFPKPEWIVIDNNLTKPSKPLEMSVCTDKVKQSPLKIKMDRTSKMNYVQRKILSEFMYAHRGLARNLTDSTQGKKHHKELWIQLTEKLNAAGPPTRPELVWRKCWTDRKQKVKNILTKNKKDTERTEGGPSDPIPLDELDLLVVKAAGLDPSEEFRSHLLMEEYEWN